MEIKYYDKQGIVSWSNSKVHSQLLACAAFDADENQLYNLDILSFNIQERSKQLNRIGNAYTDIPFRCIAWDNFGQKQGTLPHGIIFGGMQNGSLSLWNPNEMIATYQNRESPSISNIQTQSSILYAEDIEEDSFPVMCAQWNSLKNNYLAFGSTDVLLLDVGKDCSNPEIATPGKKNPHEGSYVTSVSWNKEVAHIFASASQNGLIALWDIKTETSIFQFKDSPASSSGNRNVVICWSKNISTQIAVTLDDEKRNELQIWDLRNQKGPIVVIDKVHSKGINAMDWCQTDPELILTAGRDRKVVCWNYTQDQEPLNETNINGDIYDIKWSRKLPSIFSVCTNKTTSICTLNDTNLFSYIPKWYKVPVGSTFLGNQSVLTFSESRGKVLHENQICDHSKKSPLKQKLRQLGNIINNNINEIQTSSEFNELIKAKSSSDDSDIYNYLGFNKGKIVKEVEKYTGKKRQFSTGNSQKQKVQVKARPKAYTPVLGNQAASFFAEIGAKTIQSQTRNQQQEDNENIKYDMVPRNFNWDIGKERLIKQNILIGNYQGAIDAALKCGRTAEALIIAYSVDQNTFNSILKTFFTQTTDNFITDILKHIAHKDTEELVKKYDLNKWKQCVALIYSISSSEKRKHLLKLLAKRLESELESAEDNQNQILVIQQSTPSIICYILAEQFQQIASLYYLNLNQFKAGSQQRKALAVEYGRRLIFIERNLKVETPKSKQFQMLLRQIAFISIQQNQKGLAHTIFTTFIPHNSMKYIDYLVNSTQDLYKYKPSINYKLINLPVMQPRKIQKKINNKDASSAQTNAHFPGKNKNKIFANKEVQAAKVPPPPPIVRKTSEEVSNDGFSPYDNHQKQPPSRATNNDKLRNVPPPPPPSSHKKLISPLTQNEKQPEKDQSFTKLPPSKKGPPTYHAEEIYEQEEEKPSIQSSQKLPPSKGNIEKKTPPPPPSRVHKKQSEQSFTQESKQQSYQPNIPTNMPKSKVQPPPPPPSQGSQKHIEYPQVTNTQQNYHQPVQETKRKLQPPPPRQRQQPQQQYEEVKQTKQPSQYNKKVEERKQVDYEQQRDQSIREEPVVKKTPPPPSANKKAPPPPPPRR